MIRNLIYKMSFVCFTFIISTNVNAQVKNDNETNKRIDDYLELLQLGYTEVEIFQDLGNVNFLTENYDAAAFWYEKLFNAVDKETISDSYQERYDFAMNSLNAQSPVKTNAKDWKASIKADYTLESEHGASGKLAQDSKKTFTPSMSMTKDGKVAFFSQAVKKKPEYGIFSKKEVVHEIYKAEKVNGKWKNIQRVAVCPKYYSAKHPTVSADGKRLFFASNMPGSYGKYDIYVSEIKSNGGVGIAKNLGPKVNTKKNDLYPTLADDSLLLYASDGRKGYGGLDLFAVQMSKKRLGESINLGSSINSDKDDFSLALIPEKGMGYVMTNRGKKNQLSQVAVSYIRGNGNDKETKDEAQLFKLLNDNSETDYSSTLFEN